LFLIYVDEFIYDDEYEANEKQYKQIRKTILHDNIRVIYMNQVQIHPMTMKNQILFKVAMYLLVVVQIHQLLIKKINLNKWIIRKTAFKILNTHYKENIHIRLNQRK
jgi:hypothetical protein